MVMPAIISPPLRVIGLGERVIPPIRSPFFLPCCQNENARDRLAECSRLFRQGTRF